MAVVPNPRKYQVAIVVYLKANLKLLQWVCYLIRMLLFSKSSQYLLSALYFVSLPTSFLARGLL